MRSENWINDYVFTVHNFLSHDECDHYIAMSEDIGFEDATVSIGIDSGDGDPTKIRTVAQQRVSSVRNNQRILFQNREIADFLWQRSESFVPMEMHGRHPIACNEMLRFYRYDSGQQFDWHQDFPFDRDNGEKSFWTLMVYLSDGFEGDETSFEDSYSDESFDEFQVTPQKGMALFFEHSVHHKGERILSGRKYVLRTDVMYSAEEEDSLEDDFIDEDEWD